MVERAKKSNFDEFKGKDCVSVADWLKTKGLHKLCSVSLGLGGEKYKSGSQNPKRDFAFAFYRIQN